MPLSTPEVHLSFRETRRERIVGCLLGTAVGDALGLPCKALSRDRQQKLYGNISDHRFVFGHGMLSNDTEHSCLVAQALLVSAGKPEAFVPSFAWRLRFWLLSFPPAIGLAALRALLKLWIGFPPGKSGVFSAGNGPAMRSAVISVCFGDDTRRLRALIRASTRLTHTDPKAEWAALAVAVAAHLALLPEEIEAGRYLELFRSALGDDSNQAGELVELLEDAAESAAREEDTCEFAASRGLRRGVSGYPAIALGAASRSLEDPYTSASRSKIVLVKS